MNKNYKVETKNSLWSVSFYKGCYSDASEEHYVFSGNSLEEIKLFVKQWWSEEGFVKKEDFYGKPAIKFDNELWFDKKLWGKEETDEEPDTDIDYGDTWECKINKLTVIYVSPTQSIGEVEGGK